MGKIEAYRHVIEGERVNCATTVFHALIPKGPRMTSEHLLYDNAYTLEEIYFAISHEYSAHGIFTSYIEMPDNMYPSHFFNQINKQLVHGPKSGRFQGGLVYTLESDAVPHVIGVRSVRKRGIFEIVDTSPHSNGGLIRNVRGHHLDRRVIKPEIAQGITRALAIITVESDKLSQLDCYAPDLEHHVENERNLNEIYVRLMAQRQGEI